MNKIDFVPICDWPFIHYDCEPKLERMKESSCKDLFYRWTQSALDTTCIERPREMKLFFRDGQVEGVRLVTKDGSCQDFLCFGGNLQYIPPELITDPEYHSESIDVWTLGVTLYRLLVGKYPFDDESLSHQDLFMKMFQSDYTIPVNLSKEARGLIHQMIAPQEIRIQLNDLLSHPWFTTKKKKRPKPIRLLKKIIQFIYKGPYPP
ncbi:hypothetical protein G6F46_003066 [Rhizopus delemar]|uniref:Protein kinase domain-containing protein n=2 Tax=Rhizopus TaxID=4842 RepID=A0A9P6ZBH0_9FUNG|nr:hypothetical protein G6F55_012790 [Rhizopus delemar]KAG1549226.1 hypothetical protein G6F51_003194 [Rhizopus arrhizus]KAG1499994.1 hypothetical protein G6F54_004017 [Rhizopus delemar]KAG1501643.1 hypothetical protein G6F52_012441 [Rhizopus delemar]KAG1515765.1 hypothetical protein G6F53_002664 [Rhizopus delemar]